VSNSLAESSCSTQWLASVDPHEVNKPISGYGDNFCDAMGELHDVFTKTGASVIGMVPVADSVECEASKVGPLKITSAVSELALNTLTTGHHQRQVCGSCHR